ncbi:hypothetical protein HYALB_00004882 [Hymenoscyphus albidus]|uniref:Uncharacterized protein n=1 Tax=Hymenoscyphus albidus TaxID=595503 RepID=A0A9N9LW60_9HELO|nr:hypothetical protein HYALB_00004882 [Hymenoscyphus albidus]
MERAAVVQLVDFEAEDDEIEAGGESVLRLPGSHQADLESVRRFSFDQPPWIAPWIESTSATTISSSLSSETILEAGGLNVDIHWCREGRN